MRELLLLDLAEFRCGVWKEDILSHDEQNIHWLTSKDGAVTAIAMMGAHPVSLADLSYCLGLTPARRARRCPVLVPAGHDLSVSFVVEQEVGEVEVHSSEILPLPAYLQTPFISSCVELEGKLLPLINILAVQHQVAAADYSPPVPPLHHSFQQDVLQEKNQEKKAPSLDTLRVFTCKRKSFLASAEYFSPDRASSPGPLTTLPLVPDFVQGVSLYRHQVLIILDLRRYLQLPPEQGDEEGKWLIGTVEGQGFAFVVDDDQGGVSADAGSFALLPVLIRSAWRQHAFLYERKIISVLDFRELLAFSPDEIYSQTASPHVLRVDTDKGLEAAFREQQFEILEFSLCNMTHALPDAEVRDTLPFTHCQRLAGTRGLVLGMTLYKDELLPVLDPARCFGRNSQPTSGWQLLLVCNGVLRALVLVEKVLGTRMLSVGEQRMLPFAVPQSSVYGCYPVDGQVGLILNMLALTVYFNFNDEQASELFFFSDELLPVQSDEQSVEDPAENNDSLLADDFLEPREAGKLLPAEEVNESWSPKDTKAPFIDESLEQGASALLREEPDSLVQSVVASMLSQKADGAGRSENEEKADRPEEIDGLVEDADDIFSSIVTAMLGHNDEDLDIDLDIDAGSLSQDEQEWSKEKDSARALFSDISEPLNTISEPVETGEEEGYVSGEDILPSSEDFVPAPPDKVDQENDQKNIVAHDDATRSDEAPLVILTEEQNALLLSSLAAAFPLAPEVHPQKAENDVSEKSVSPFLTEKGEVGREKKLDRDAEDTEGVEDIAEITKQSVQREQIDISGKSEQADYNEIEKIAPENENECIAAEPHQARKADNQKADKESSEANTWNTLEETGLFPEFREFAQGGSRRAQQGGSFLDMPHAEFVQQVKFPALSSPDPRKIKEQLDRVRQKERDLLFRGVSHDLAEDSQALQSESTKDHRLRRWVFLFLLGLFFGFQVWFFAFQDQDQDRLRGKSITSTAGIAERTGNSEKGSDSSPAIQEQFSEHRKEQETVSAFAVPQSTGKESGKEPLEQFSQKAVEQKEPDRSVKETVDQTAKSGNQKLSENNNSSEHFDNIYNIGVLRDPDDSGSNGIVQQGEEEIQEPVQGDEKGLFTTAPATLPPGQGDQAGRVSRQRDNIVPENLAAASSAEMMNVEVRDVNDVIEVKNSGQHAVITEKDAEDESGDEITRSKEDKEAAKNDQRSTQRRATALLRGMGRETRSSQDPEKKRKSEAITRLTEEKKESNQLPKKSSDHPLHTVNKGDTLWKISEKYTGSGFNYPDVAKKNKIGNPDLIYPDQQVRLPELPAQK